MCYDLLQKNVRFINLNIYCTQRYKTIIPKNTIRNMIKKNNIYVFVLLNKNFENCMLF